MERHFFFTSPFFIRNIFYSINKDHNYNMINKFIYFVQIKMQMTTKGPASELHQH